MQEGRKPAGTRLSMCLKPQQTAEMNTPHSALTPHIGMLETSDSL